jgi:hypothetical protein
MRTLISTLCLFSLLPLAAHAEEFQIGNRDVPGLIRALQQSALTPEADRIVLAAGGIYTLEHTDSTGLGLPPLRGELQIDGNGAEIRRYASIPMTLMEIAEGAEVEISDLTLAEGSLGALRNFGTLTLEGVSITDSVNDAANAIVLNQGTLKLRDSLIGYNQLSGNGSGHGVVLNLGSLDLQRSKIVGNSFTRESIETQVAAAVVNQGELTASAIEFSGNEISDPFGDLRFASVINLGSGTSSGLSPQNLLIDVAEAIDPR